MTRDWAETWRYADWDEHGNPLVQYKADGLNAWGHTPDDEWKFAFPGVKAHHAKVRISVALDMEEVSRETSGK